MKQTRPTKDKKKRAPTKPKKPLATKAHEPAPPTAVTDLTVTINPVAAEASSTSWVGPPASPPWPPHSQSMEEAANEVVQQYAVRQRSFAFNTTPFNSAPFNSTALDAVTDSGAAPPASTSAPVANALSEPVPESLPRPLAQTEAPPPLGAKLGLEVRPTAIAAATAKFGSVHAVAGSIVAIERKLLESPDEIRAASRRLAAAFTDEVDELKKSKPNEIGQLAQYNHLKAFFEKMASGLADLADALDRAVDATAASPQPSHEPIFLGKAAEIARGLQILSQQWLEQTGPAAIDVPIRVGVLCAGIAFLHSLGADGAAAVAALGWLVRPRGPNAKAKKRSTRKQTET